MSIRRTQWTRRVLFALTASVLLSLSHTAEAEPEPAAPPTDRAAARAAFDRGSALFEKEEYAEALVEFRRAYTLSPHDEARVPIATCLEKLARFREALQQWETMAESETVGASIKEQAQEALSRLRPRLATLSVTGTPDGAEVFVDDVARCVVPCTTSVDPREHLVVVRQEGRESRHRVLATSGETTRIRITLGTPKPFAKAPTPAPPSPEMESAGPSALTWIGVGAAAIGVGGIIGFGLHTRALGKRFDDDPTAETFDDGVMARTITNISIGVAAAGALAVAIDLIFLAPREVPITTPTGRRPRGLVFHF